MKRLIAAACILGLTGCASASRLMSYSDGQMTFDGRVYVEGRIMSLSVHPRDNALLVQKSVGDASTGGAIQGLTLGFARGWQPDPRKIDEALAVFGRPVGCSFSPVVTVGDTAYEGRWSCPAGTDLRALMADQRDTLRRGEPIRP